MIFVVGVSTMAIYYSSVITLIFIRSYSILVPVIVVSVVGPASKVSTLQDELCLSRFYATQCYELLPPKLSFT